MKSAVTIRLAVIEDLLSILDISHELFVHDEAWIDGIVMDWSYSENAKRLFTNYITQKKGICYVAELDSKVVGYISGDLKEKESWRDVQLADISNVMILEDYRKEGIGKQLMKAFIDWAKSKGANRLTVEASYPNSNAIEFYKSVGFEPYTLILEQPISD